MAYKLVICILVAAAAYLIRQHYFPPLVNSPIVEISTGKLQGRISVSRDGRNYYEYLGVPYAKPPLGQLRYETPEPMTQKWDGVRDATKVGSVCLQVDTFLKIIKGSEDCLFLNIHTPKLEDVKLPVIFWIHGGRFVFGSGNMYRPDYFMDEDVVLVTVNYRLASFGFLNTGDGAIRGNMGLKDQNMALRWVRDNIHTFGGNPNDVTIFGQSAGGASVHFQMVSPMSKGLFHKAIAQSGLVTNPWAIYPNPGKQAKRFANQANCASDSIQEMVKCLKSRDAKELVSIHMECTDPLRPFISIFVPTIEKDLNDGKSFLAENPQTLIESGKFSRVPFLTGVNSGEGLYLSAPIVVNKTIANNLVKDWTQTLTLLMPLPENLESAVAEKIKTYYKLGDFDPDNPIVHREKMTNVISDWMWNVGFHNAMKTHLKFVTPSSPLFIYYYSYLGEFSLDQYVLAIKGNYHPIVEIVLMKVTNWIKTNLLGQRIPRYGACHGDEGAMEFYIANMASIQKGSLDYQFSKQIVNVITQFVKLDTKSSKQSTLEFMAEKWTPQEGNKRLKYFQLDVKPKVIAEPFQDRIAFWNSLKLQ